MHSLPPDCRYVQAGLSAAQGTILPDAAPASWIPAAAFATERNTWTIRPVFLSCEGTRGAENPVDGAASLFCAQARLPAPWPLPPTKPPPNPPATRLPAARWGAFSRRSDPMRPAAACLRRGGGAPRPGGRRGGGGG